LEPDRCYICWDIELTTPASADEIRDVFIFVEDACELAIEAQSEPDVPSEPAPSATAPTQKSEAKPLSRETADKPGDAAKPATKPWGRRAYDTPDNASSIRVPAPKLDQLVNLLGELVTVQARLNEIAAGREDPLLASVSEEVERLTAACPDSRLARKLHEH
jgi:two-component system chemotaxis sensor kinase CheA